MNCGIKDVREVDGAFEIVRCNNCYFYFYEDIDDRDDYALEFIQDGQEFFKGCRNCKTDAYLMDINSEHLTILQGTQNFIQV